ncbi:MAG: hypothetical protein ACTSSG_04820 [Candidatus Heimdallarchaeaceae archaeon]
MTLYYSSPSFRKIIKKVLMVNLAIKEGEKLVLATEYPTNIDFKEKAITILEKVLNRIILVKSIYEIAKEELKQAKVDLFFYPSPWKHNSKLPENILKKFSQYDVLFILSEYSITAEIINLGKKYPKIRAALSPFVDETIFDIDGPLNVDEQELEKEVLFLYKKLKEGKKCQIYNNMGTKLSIDLFEADVNYETGKIEKPGTIKNLPAGEVAIGHAKIDGTFVAPKGWLEGFTEDIEIQIKDSKIETISRKEQKIEVTANYQKQKKEKIRIDHISIGMNKNAKNPFILVELAKMKGVLCLITFLHRNLGIPINTTSFPGIFPTPKINLKIDDQLILKNGRVIVTIV